MFIFNTYRVQYGATNKFTYHRKINHLFAYFIFALFDGDSVGILHLIMIMSVVNDTSPIQLKPSVGYAL